MVGADRSGGSGRSGPACQRVGRLLGWSYGGRMPDVTILMLMSGLLRMGPPPSLPLFLLAGGGGRFLCFRFM